MLCLMIFPLVTFEAKSLLSQAPYFLIEHIILVVERCLLRLLCVISAYLIQGLLDGEFIDYGHHTLP